MQLASLRETQRLEGVRIRTAPRHARRRERSRAVENILFVALLAFGLSSVLQLFRPVAAQADELSDLMNESSNQLENSASAAADAATQASCEADRAAYEATLPVPSPAAGLTYVVQLVNESDQVILAGANAAHQPDTQGIPVLPREGTWVMQPKGKPGSVLTIDIPKAWERTICGKGTSLAPGCVGPLFWARTGCKYDTAHNLTQCETADCGGFFDCSSASPPGSGTIGLSPVGPKAIAEWTFNDTNGNCAPDISVVDGVNLNMDIVPINPIHQHMPSNQFWLDHPLTKCGEDQRTAGNCPISDFQLKRKELGSFIQDQKGGGGGDQVAACFSNCGRYKFEGANLNPAACGSRFRCPGEPPLDCDPTKPGVCHDWKAFCCAFPVPGPSPYDGPCNPNDNKCTQNAACWDKTNYPPKASASVCACSAYIKKPDCPSSVCTFPYSSTKPGNQPPFGHCGDVDSNLSACIGDDTIHEVMPYGLTWPNDPETFFSDATIYRIVFSPGGNPVPITPSGPVPLCSSLPDTYRYQTELTTDCSAEIAGGAVYAGARRPGDDPHTNLWDCVLAGPNAAGVIQGKATTGVLCTWAQDGFPFFQGEVSDGNHVYHLTLANGQFLGYYNDSTWPIIYHYGNGAQGAGGLGNERVYPVPSEATTARGVYFYDYGLKHFLYTNPSSFPYFYDYTLQHYLYYYVVQTGPTRYFTDTTTGVTFPSAPG